MGLVPEEALLSRIKRAEAKAEDLFASLKGSLTVSSNRFQSQVEGLAAELKGIDGRVLSSALVGTIRITQIEPGFATAQELNALEAIVVSNDDLIRSAISESSKVASNETSALGRKFQHITARIDGDISAAASASSLLEARVTVNEGNITAIASDVVTLQADFDAADVSGAGSAISALDTRVTAVEGTVTSHSSDITTLQSDLTAAEGDITTNGSAISANGSAISALDTRVTSAEGTITSHSSDITTLQSDLTAAEGDITANGSAISALNTRVTSAEGTITAHASDITTLQADLTTAEGDISSNASAVSAIDVRVTSAEGTISSHTSDISTLTSTVGGNTSSISTIASNIVTVQGDITSIEQEWGVAFDVNGRTTGRIQLDGTGETTTFDILATAFRVSDASTAVEVFSIVGSKARFTTDVEIDGSLLISGSLTVGQVTDAVSSSTLTSGLAGKIDDGSAAADINANATTISGAKITTGTIDANRLNVSTLSAITADLGTVTAGSITSSSTIDIGSSENRTQITTSGLTVGNLTIDGASNQNDIAISGAYGVTITGGAAAASVIVSNSTSKVALTEASGLLFGTHSGGWDTDLFRESSDVLKTNDSFKCYRAETTGGGMFTQGLTIEQGSGYAVQEMNGPSGALIDLRPNSVGDYKLRLIADTGQASIQTAANYDLQLTPGGTGNVRFGTYVGSAQTITGYITIKDASGTTRKLAVVS